MRAVAEIEHGLIDTQLANSLIKKLLAQGTVGKRTGYRTLLACRSHDRAIFFYGFAKSSRTNISTTALAALKHLAKQFISYSPEQLTQAKRLALTRADDDE